MSGRLAAEAIGRDQQGLALDHHRHDTHRTLVGALGLAGLERNHPVVQRAGYRGAMHDALAERSTFMRAAILHGENAIVGGTEDGDAAKRRGNAARPAAGNVGQLADMDPFRHSPTPLPAPGRFWPWD